MDTQKGIGMKSNIDEMNVKELNIFFFFDCIDGESIWFIYFYRIALSELHIVNTVNDFLSIVNRTACFIIKIKYLLGKTVCQTFICIKDFIAYTNYKLTYCVIYIYYWV